MLRSLRFANYVLLLLDIVALLAGYHLGHVLRKGFPYPDFILPGSLWFIPFLVGLFLVMDVYNPWSHYSRMGIATRMLPSLLILGVVLSLVAFLVFGYELQAYVGRSVLYFAPGFLSIYAVSSLVVFARMFDQAKMRNRWLILTEKRFLEPIDKEIRRRFPVREVAYPVRDSLQPVRGPAGRQALPMKTSLTPADVFKFRTMVIGADKLDPYTQKGDNRITRSALFSSAEVVDDKKMDVIDHAADRMDRIA